MRVANFVGVVAGVMVATAGLVVLCLGISDTDCVGICSKLTGYGRELPPFASEASQGAVENPYSLITVDGPWCSTSQAVVWLIGAAVIFIGAGAIAARIGPSSGLIRGALAGMFAFIVLVGLNGGFETLSLVPSVLAFNSIMGALCAALGLVGAYLVKRFA